MPNALRAALAFVPLAITPFLGFLLAEGHLDLGGGEKDLIWLVPWLVWSLLFAISALVLQARRWDFARALTRSGLVATLGVLVAALCLAVAGQLGIAGRF